MRSRRFRLAGRLLCGLDCGLVRLRVGRRHALRYIAGVSLALTLVVGACNGRAFVAPALPPATAPPAVVLDTYLRAFGVGDCPLARALWLGTHAVGDGDLCGATHLMAFTIRDQPAAPTSGMFVYATTLTTDGTADGTVPSGAMTWFFTLAQQPGGSWRISGGGSGP